MRSVLHRHTEITVRFIGRKGTDHVSLLFHSVAGFHPLNKDNP